MSLELNNLIKEPEYFHREYQNDLPKEEAGSYLDQSRRFALVALPFLSLYKPFSYPLSLAFGGIRTVVSLTQLFDESEKGLTKDSLIAFFQSTVAITAFAGTIFAHPLGMLITTVNDVATESIHVGQNIYQGEYKAAMSGSIQIVNNALYLALFTHGGIELLIASLAMQTLIGLGNSVSEYQEGNYLEAGGHFLMAMIRGNQMVRQIQVLQYQKKMEEIILKHKNENKAGMGMCCDEDPISPIVIGVKDGEFLVIDPSDLREIIDFPFAECFSFEISDINRQGKVVGTASFSWSGFDEFYCESYLWHWDSKEKFSIIIRESDFGNLFDGFSLSPFDVHPITNYSASLDDLGKVYVNFDYARVKDGEWKWDSTSTGTFTWTKEGGMNDLVLNYPME